ncbi:MAG: hypothetical protein JO069_12260 [Verrucomicrobia bacterium]|nr:hypothetical protein [Verrucomicrobiota bacterium]
MLLKLVKIELKLPWVGGIEGMWEADEVEAKAAWELYVELITRVSIVELRPDEGLLREALDSFYSLFKTTRGILRQYGPGVGKPKGEGNLSFGLLAIAVVNTVLRPILSKWHPLLEDYESTKPAGVSPLAHERAWDKAPELRGVLNAARETLMRYAGILAEVAGVPSSLPPNGDLVE